jgi:hypothetical protein
MIRYVVMLGIAGGAALVAGLLSLLFPWVLYWATTTPSFLSDVWAWWSGIFEGMMPQYQESSGTAMAVLLACALPLLLVAAILLVVHWNRARRSWKRGLSVPRKGKVDPWNEP